jgi:type I restriction enzyme S subunit
MELKQGYKQTEVGVMPEDWKIEIIDNFTTRIGDGIHSTPIYNETGEYSFINGNNLKNGKIIIDEKTKSVDSIEFRKHKRELNDNTILLSINGTIGNVAFYCKEDIVLGKSAAYINLNNKVSKEYLYFKLQSPEIQLFFYDNLTGSTIKNLGLNTIRNTPVSLPPTLEEQKAIATALSDVDHLITNLDDLIAKKKAIKQGAMQQLLTPPSKACAEPGRSSGKRLNGFDGEWLEKSLGDVAKYKNGAAHENCVVKSGDFIIVNSKFVSTEGRVAKYSNENRCPVYKDDILMVLSDVPNGKAIAKCFYVEQDNRYTLNQRICAFTSTDLDSKFLFLLLNRNSYFLLFDDGVKQTNLRNDDVLNCPLIIPPTSEEQKAIAQILSDMDKELEELATKKEKYEHIKQGMMQELLTGKTRLV